MTIEEANYLAGAERFRVQGAGLERHGLDAIKAMGTYVSQFESPKNGRLVVVKLDDGGAFGFRLDELELAG